MPNFTCTSSEWAWTWPTIFCCNLVTILNTDLWILSFTTYLVHIWLDCQDQIPKPLLHLSWCGQAGSESEFCFLFCRKKQNNWLIDWIEFYAVLAIFQPAATKDFFKIFISWIITFYFCFRIRYPSCRYTS